VQIYFNSTDYDSALTIAEYQVRLSSAPYDVGVCACGPAGLWRGEDRGCCVITHDVRRAYTTQAYAAPTDDVKNFNRRDRGILFYLMKRYPEATEALSEYLEADPEVGDGRLLPCLDERETQRRGN